MNNNYIKFKFEIQLLSMYLGSNGKIVYTVSVYKIYFYLYSNKSEEKVDSFRTQIDQRVTINVT